MPLTFAPAKFVIQFVRRHDEIDMRARAYDFERELKSYINQQVAVMNVPPNAPGNVARFTLSDGKRSLTVANNTTILSLDLDHGVPKGNKLSDIMKRAADHLDRLDNYYASTTQAYAGIIATAFLPYSGSTSDVAQVLADATLQDQIRTKGPFEGVTLAINKMHGNLQTVIELSGYKLFEQMFTNVPSGFVPQIDVDFAQPTDQGLQIKVDVNTKPLIQSYPSGAFATVASRVIDLFKTEVPAMVGPLVTVQ